MFTVGKLGSCRFVVTRTPAFLTLTRGPQMPEWRSVSPWILCVSRGL
jgi:hypothetical protein